MTFRADLFESEAAQAEFEAAESTIGSAEADLLRSVLGKPSQFVGRVVSLGTAREHWVQWNSWQAAERAAAELKAREKAANGDQQKLERAQLIAEVEAARTAWHQAVTDAKENEQQWSAWTKLQIEQLRANERAARATRDEFVRSKRQIYQDLKFQATAVAKS